VAELGLSKLKPGGSSIEQIVECLRVLPLEAQYCPLDSDTYNRGCMEVLAGLLGAVRLEWGGLISFKFPYELVASAKVSKSAIKGMSKSSSAWVQALLHLCEKVSTFAEAEYGLTGISSMTIFRAALEDVARCGGLSVAIASLYPWTDRNHPLANDYDKRKYIALMNNHCTRLKAFDSAVAGGSVFNELIMMASILAERQTAKQRQPFTSFCAESRRYVSGLKGGGGVAEVRWLDDKGQLHQKLSSGKGRGMISNKHNRRAKIKTFQ